VCSGLRTKCLEQLHIVLFQRVQRCKRRLCVSSSRRLALRQHRLNIQQRGDLRRTPVNNLYQPAVNEKAPKSIDTRSDSPLKCLDLEDSRIILEQHPEETGFHFVFREPLDIPK
jgi:hypothetical protein